MGFQFHKGSPKSDWAEDIRNCIQQLSQDYRDLDFASLDRLTKGELMALAAILEDAVRTADDKRKEIT